MSDELDRLRMLEAEAWRRYAAAEVRGDEKAAELYGKARVLMDQTRDAGLRAGATGR